LHTLEIPLDSYISGEPIPANLNSSSSSSFTNIPGINFNLKTNNNNHDANGSSGSSNGSSHIPLVTRRGLAFAPLDATSTKEWSAGEVQQHDDNGYTINENGNYTKNDTRVDGPGGTSDAGSLDSSFNDGTCAIPHSSSGQHRRYQNNQVSSCDYGMSASSDCLVSSLTSTPSESSNSFFSSNTPTEWACSACTFINPITRLRCDVCDTERSMG
jgi:hypothetical protein